MKLKFENTVEVNDAHILEAVNEFQESHDFEYFDTLDECPNELILMALYYTGEIETIFYDDIDPEQSIITIV